MGDWTFPLPGIRASVPALVVPDVATRRLPVGAPMLPKACAAWLRPCDGVKAAFWW